MRRLRYRLATGSPKQDVKGGYSGDFNRRARGSALRAEDATVRPSMPPAGPEDRTSYEPGDQVQCDPGFPDGRIPVGAGKPRVLPVLVIVSLHSRFIMARVIPPRRQGTDWPGRGS